MLQACTEWTEAMAPKILDVHHLKMGTALVFDNGEEKVNLIVLMIFVEFSLGSSTPMWDSVAGSGDMGKGTECASLRMDGNPGFSSALMLSFFSTDGNAK